MGRVKAALFLLFFLAAAWWSGLQMGQESQGPRQERERPLAGDSGAKLSQLRGYECQRTQTQWSTAAPRRCPGPRGDRHGLPGPLHPEACQHHPQGGRQTAEVRRGKGCYGSQMGGVPKGAEAIFPAGAEASCRTHCQGRCRAGGAPAAEGERDCRAAGGLPQPARGSPAAHQRGPVGGAPGMGRVDAGTRRPLGRPAGSSGWCFGIGPEPPGNSPTTAPWGTGNPTACVESRRDSATYPSQSWYPAGPYNTDHEKVGERDGGATLNGDYYHLQWDGWSCPSRSLSDIPLQQPSAAAYQISLKIARQRTTSQPQVPLERTGPDPTTWQAFREVGREKGCGCGTGRQGPCQWPRDRGDPGRGGGRGDASVVAGRPKDPGGTGRGVAQNAGPELYYPRCGFFGSSALCFIGKAGGGHWPTCPTGEAMYILSCCNTFLVWEVGTSQAAFLPPLRLWSDGVTIPFGFVSIGLELRLSTHSGTAPREATTTITVGTARSMMSLTSPTSSGTTS